MATRRFSRALAITGPATGAPFCQLLTVGKSVNVLEVNVIANNASADSNIGLIRSATVGTATTTNVGEEHRISGPSPTALIATAWSAAPTIASPALYLGRVPVLAGVTASFGWTFKDGDEDLVIAGNSAGTSSLLLWNYGAGTSSDIEVRWVWDEEF